VVHIESTLTHHFFDIAIRKLAAREREEEIIPEWLFLQYYD
jgi:hypothetical protein